MPKQLTTSLQTSIGIENKDFLSSNLLFIFYYKLQQKRKKWKIVRWVSTFLNLQRLLQH